MATTGSIKIPVELEGIVNVAVIKPGESLVLSFNMRLNNMQAHDIMSRLRELLPGVNVAVVDNSAYLSVLPKADDSLRVQINGMIDERLRFLRRGGRILCE